MFSATIPPRIERLAKEMMTEPIVVTVGEVSDEYHEGGCDTVQ